MPINTNILDLGDTAAGVSEFLGGAGQAIGRLLRPPDLTRENLNVNDFKEGFVIKEQAFENEGGDAERNLFRIELKGNRTPISPFMHAGEQRVEKTYYPGSGEPVVQVLGPRESDISIRGQIKDIYGVKPAQAGAATAAENLRNVIEVVRIRGNLCIFELGDWKRFGYIRRAEFSMQRRTRMNYKIDLIIASHNKPVNGRFLRPALETPTFVNALLVDAATNINTLVSLAPDLPTTALSLIQGATDTIVNAIGNVSALVDRVFSSVEEARRGIERLGGFIRSLQLNIGRYQRRLSSFDAFTDPNQAVALDIKYRQAAFFSSVLVAGNGLASLAEQLRQQIEAITASLPLANYVIKQGDTWQSISIQFYGSAESWKRIPDYNGISLTAPIVPGSVVEIPRE